MDSGNVTFGEGSSVLTAKPASDTRALILSLRQKIESLEKELDHMKEEVAKLEH